MITDTSLEAFEKILPKINDRQELILRLLKDLEPRTDAMITQDLGLKINQVTPRRNELVKKGCIEISHKDICKITGGRSTYWKITQCGLEVNNFRERREY
jgi:hypothetical protein